MTKAISFPLAAVIAVVGFFALATTASAASITNIKFTNGDVTYQGTSGSSVTAEFRVTVGAGEVVEQFEIDVIGDGLAPRCYSVGDSRGLEEGTHFISRSIQLPPNTGTYSVDVRTAGIFGGNRSVDCNDGVNGSEPFANALRVATSGSSNDGVGGSTPDEAPAWLQTLLAAILGNQADDEESAACSELNDKLAGTVTGVYNDANVRLQGFLLSEGMSIPALAAGASFGFRGPQTNSAIASYKAMHGCN